MSYMRHKSLKDFFSKRKCHSTCGSSQRFLKSSHNSANVKFWQMKIRRCTRQYADGYGYAFGIGNRLMNPFSIRNMEYHERIFNYRLSRARRVVENAFGILANKFRVLLRTMAQTPVTCRKIITSCVILHNLFRIRYPAAHNNLMDLEDQNLNVTQGAWRHDKVLLDVFHERARNTGTQEGRHIRRYLGHYFTSSAGSVPWQDKIIL